MAALSSSHSRSEFARGAVLATLILAAYALALPGEFLWDDDLHITANPTIVGPLGLKEIWTTSRANYFPLVLTNFWVQHALWGLEPLGYHVVTLLFHAAAAVLLWRVLVQLHVPGAWFGAAFWALHPVQVESVAWICELKNTQSAVFFLAAIWCYVRWLQAEGRARPLAAPEVLHALEPRRAQRSRPTVSGRTSFYALALGCFVAALLSKPSTVMLPPVLGLLAWWQCGRLDWREVLRLVPFFALSALVAGWTIWEQKFHSGAIGPEWSQTFPERIAIAGRAIWFYLGKLFWPEPLIFIYPRWQIDVANPLAYLGALAAVLAGGALLWHARRPSIKPVFVAAVYFVALLFPVLGFFSVYFFRYSFVGDHFQYLASMGPLVLAGAAVARFLPRGAPLAGAAIVLALGIATARQTLVYRSNETLWRDTLAHNPAATMAWLNLADTYAQGRRYDESLRCYRRALEIRPNDPYALNDLGNVLVLTGRPAEAVPHFERALALKPLFPEAHSNFGHALRALGRPADAIFHYRRALELQPNDPTVLNNLGAELAEQGRPAEALPLFEEAVRLKPDNGTAHDNLAGALRALGRHEEALAQHREAVRLLPDFAEAHLNHARTLVAAGRPADSFPHFERGLSLKPDIAVARGQYARALAAAGRPADGLAQLQRAVELSPKSAEAQINLGVALAESGRAAEALASFEAAVRLAPDFPAAHANLGNALASLRRWADAVPHFASAAALQPHSAPAQVQLAIALVNAGQLAAAVQPFEAALRIDPAAVEVHENFSQVLNALGRRREAFEHMEEAARLRREKLR